MRTILKHHNKKLQLKVKLSYCPQRRLYLIHQNEMETHYKKLSTAIYTFETLVFRTFSNRLVLAEMEEK